MPWHVVQTRRHKEFAAAEELRQQARGPGCTLRTYVVTGTRMRWRGTGRGRVKEPVPFPVFGRYIFVSVESDEDEEIVRATRGVVDFLRCPERRPWILPDKDVTRFRIAEAAGLFDFTPKRVTFGEGQPLRVVRGPFIGLKAKYLSRMEDDRVRVLMQSLIKGGRDCPHVMDIDDVEAVA